MLHSLQSQHDKKRLQSHQFTPPMPLHGRMIIDEAVCVHRWDKGRIGGTFQCVSFGTHTHQRQKLIFSTGKQNCSVLVTDGQPVVLHSFANNFI